MAGRRAKPIELDRPRAEMIFSSPVKAPPAYEQDVGGVDLQEFLLRMTSPFRWPVLQEGRKKANIYTNSGAIRGIPGKSGPEWGALCVTSPFCVHVPLRWLP
jgi:hypothetical protein